MEILENAVSNSPSDIEEILAENPAVLEILSTASEEAFRTQSEEKVELLARVASQALRYYEDDEKIDQVRFFLRTVRGLDSHEMRLLVIIASPSIGEGDLVDTAFNGYPTNSVLKGRWPSSAVYLQPMLSALTREGLIEDKVTAENASASEVAWGITSYGRTFIEMLLEDRIPADRSWSELTIRVSGPNAVSLRNIGLGDATVHRLEGNPGNWDALAMKAISPDQELESKLAQGNINGSNEYRFTIKWSDRTGLHNKACNL